MTEKKEETETIVNENPVSSEALASVLHFALVEEERGALKTAELALKALLIVDPSTPYFHAMLGSVQQRQGDYEGAEQQYREALKLFPFDIESLTNLGEILLRTEQVSEGAQFLKEAVELDFESNHPYARRARFLLSGLTNKGNALSSGRHEDSTNCRRV